MGLLSINMHLPDHFFSGKDDKQLRSFVQNLLDTVEGQSVQIEKLTEENETLRAEIRHLKKHKGKPKIRPNVSDQTDEDEQDATPSQDATDSGCAGNKSSHPPKNKRPKRQNLGETASPPVSVDREEICEVPNPQDGWRFKGYDEYLHTELELKFVTTMYKLLFNGADISRRH